MMPKRFVVAAAPLAASVAVVMSLPGAAGAAAPLKSCKSPGQEIGHIRVRGTSCTVAVKVIGADGRGKNADRFRCRTTGKFSGGVNETCKRGSAEILYDVYEG